ncbi:hypothetical protein KKC91_12430, partial [bacterium]|nr:hypothetical protein [bacterium]
SLWPAYDAASAKLGQVQQFDDFLTTADEIVANCNCAIGEGIPHAEHHSFFRKTNSNAPCGLGETQRILIHFCMRCDIP